MITTVHDDDTDLRARLERYRVAYDEKVREVDRLNGVLRAMSAEMDVLRQQAASANPFPPTKIGHTPRLPKVVPEKEHP